MAFFCLGTYGLPVTLEKCKYKVYYIVFYFSVSVINRKNFLFCNTPKGAQASAIVQSIIETAKANNLKPMEYLTYLFEKLPNINLEDKEELTSLLPWSETIPSECIIQSQNNK